MSDPLASKHLLTIPEFSRQYGISRSRIYEELREGRLRGVKLGRKTLIRRTDADDWAAALPEYDSGAVVHADPTSPDIAA